MAGLPKFHCLMVGLALALLVAPGGANLGLDVDSERSLESTYSDAEDGAGPRNGEDLKACGLESHERMYSDGMEKVALSEDCKGGQRSPPSWMLPEPEVADQVQKAEAPAPSSSASDVAAGLAWTGLGLLLSSSGLFMARRRQ
ncbi:hypothetical protein Taro_045553 [Colocasia esculenta]|uniref:Uncharacterized protein n=1 Tax=Colocasia esculenta TaxID=4460 RepID=A0A843X2Y6_COLES|nr:hypothetical protein [Colocasia esculenta]